MRALLIVLICFLIIGCKQAKVKEEVPIRIISQPGFLPIGFGGDYQMKVYNKHWYKTEQECIDNAMSLDGHVRQVVCVKAVFITELQ